MLKPNSPKNEPARAPPLARETMALLLEDSLKTPTAPDSRDLSISLRISGGLPSKQYLFDFHASADGNVRCRMRCELSRREGEAQKRAKRASQFARLSRSILASGLLRLEPTPPGFWPDTLVGVLEIAKGAASQRWYFVADDEQAKTQEKVPPASIRRAVEAIYDVAEEVTGLKNVRP